MQRAQNPLAARARRRRRVGGLPQNPPLRQISERRGFDMLGGDAEFVARANSRRARQIAQARDQRVVFRAAAAQNNKRRFRFANLGGDCRGGEFEQSRLRHARVLAAQNRLEAADIEFLAAATFGRSPPQKTPRAVAFQQPPQQAATTAALVAPIRRRDRKACFCAFDSKRPSAYCRGRHPIRARGSSGRKIVALATPPILTTAQGARRAKAN